MDHSTHGHMLIKNMICLMHVHDMSNVYLGAFVHGRVPTCTIFVTQSASKSVRMGFVKGCLFKQ